MEMNKCYFLLEAEFLHFEVVKVVLQAQISLAGAYPQFLGSLPLLLDILQPVERTPPHQSCRCLVCPRDNVNVGAMKQSGPPASASSLIPRLFWSLAGELLPKEPTLFRSFLMTATDMERAPEYVPIKGVLPQPPTV